MRHPVINALGVLDNANLLNRPEGIDEATLAYAGRAAAADERALADAKASGLCAMNLTLGPVAVHDDDPFIDCVSDIAYWDVFIRRNAGSVRKIFNGADIDAARQAGQVGLIYGFQNTHMLADDLERIDVFSHLGVRVFQLTYNGRNTVGCGATVPDDDGLTDFGAQVLERLEASRVLVDLSHSSERTCLDALRLARRPLAITHTGCRAIADHPRNKSDAELRELAGKGGVVGMYFMPYLRLQGQPMAEDLIAHLEHAIHICGEDHVGLGTDGGTTAIDDMEACRARLAQGVELRRQHGIGAPGETAEVVLFLPDLEGPTQFQRLAELLAARGHSESRIEKILHGNFRRLMGEAWA